VKTVPDIEEGALPHSADHADDAVAAVRSPNDLIASIDADIFHDVDVRVTAVLGNGSIAVRALLDLREGDVVNLDTPLDGVVDVTVNGRTIAQGEIVAVGEKFGVRLTKIEVERR
jgi:flagellar motor switch protein FliN